MIPIDFPLTPSPVAIILNGAREANSLLKINYSHYDVIILCDGAWHDAIDLIPLQLLKQNKEVTVIALGDGDSIVSDIHIVPSDFIKIEDSSTTDFEKALQWIRSNYLKPSSNKSDEPRESDLLGINLGERDLLDIDLLAVDLLDIDVYWANGGELDHTLGNMAIASKYSPQFTCHFFTDKQYYRYVNSDVSISNAKGKVFSIFPYPQCTVKKTTGIIYPMTNYAMQVDTQQSLRNQIAENSETAMIEFEIHQDEHKTMGCFVFVQVI